MTRQKIFLASVLLFASLKAFCIDGNIRFELNHPDGRYAAGDTVTVTAVPVGEYSSPLEMTIYRNGIRGGTTQVGPIDRSRVVYRDASDGPVAVMLEFRPSGTTPADASFDLEPGADALKIGYVIDEGGFEPGFKTPSGLRRYWRRQVRRLRRMPMTVKAVPVGLPDENGIECFNVEISSIDSIPVRGYLARPVNASPGTLPAVLNLHSAGVSGLWCRAKVKDARRALRYAPFFDCALLLKGCKAGFFVEIGLVDTCCPPSEVFSGINGIAGPVTVVTSPYRNHWEARIPAMYMPWWKENVEKPRREYISSHLGAKK